MTTSRWLPVAAYTAVSAANQMLWLTYTPITTGSAQRYGVSSGAIGWLAELFPLLYVVLAVPAGRLIDRDLPRWLAVGAVLTAAGALMRLGGHEYALALTGQLFVAVAQPLVLNAVIPVTTRFLAPGDRAAGLAVGSAGIFAGMVFALLLGTAFGAHRLAALLLVQAVLSVLAALALLIAVRSRGGAAPAAATVPLRTVWADRQVRLLVALVCAGFGVFIALTTWLQTLLDPAGVSSDAAGVLLLVMVIAGVLGSALLPAPIAARGRQLQFVLGSVLAGVLGLVVLAVAPGVASGAVVLAVLGVFLLTDLPLILELVERRAPQAGGTASGLVWLAGNAAGLVAALVVQTELHHPALAFGTLAVLLAAGAPLLAALRRSRLAPVTTRSEPQVPA
ncbi:MFS transporter [uncultured Jatrophihabitans sp.]|uniref:MFS transporter n=1 Tax=uncultured Jatrophihabitans sp. TaxID=1610747 RepID=UPI0035C9D5FE